MIALEKDRLKFDAIILGAGAAGLMCAAIAGVRGKKILLIEHANEPGKKILISGGGRCNFTNLSTPAECYISKNPHFAKSALQRYTPQDFIALVDQHRIAWHEKTLGQLFCDGPAKQIVEMLLNECNRGDFELSLGESISDVTHAENTFQVKFGNRTATTHALVIATGGPSIPKMGASSFAYNLARKFHLKVVEPRPALVPLTLGQDEALFRSLSGVSTEIIARCSNAEFREAALFTHKGLSGPSILQISSYWDPGEAVSINFLPNFSPGWFLKMKENQPRAGLKSAMSKILPTRLAETLADKLVQAEVAECELANLKDQTLQTIEHKLANWVFMPNGTEGFAKAEVTKGGISTTELSSKTMESKNISGLYIIGEAVDVTGWLGGYNFQWAWSSGWAAGQAL